MWKAPANLPKFSKQDKVIDMFRGHAQMLWAWSWIAPDHLRADNLDAWKEAIASFEDDPSCLLDLARAHVREREWRAQNPGGPLPWTPAQKLRASAIHRAAKMVLMVRELLTHWYPLQSGAEINTRSNEIVEALWDDSLRTIALAEEQDNGAVILDPKGAEVTTNKLENYLKRPPDDPRRLV